MMAGDWIKMRGSLLNSPKLIALARILHAQFSFREWLTPGEATHESGQLVSDDALRCVTCALLLRVWSSAREHGRYECEDLVFPCITIDDIDSIAGVKGIGQGMVAVGWARNLPGGNGVSLPNFREYNVPPSSADRQKNYRTRKKSTDESARYDPLQRVTRKRREEKSINTPPHNPPEGGNGVHHSHTIQTPLEIPVSLNTAEFLGAWEEWKQHRTEKKKKLTPTSIKRQFNLLEKIGPGRAVAAIHFSIAQGYTGIFEPEGNGNGTTAGTGGRPGQRMGSNTRIQPSADAIAAINAKVIVCEAGAGPGLFAGAEAPDPPRP